MMYKRIIVAVASALFALLALLAIIITDLYDRDFPQAIGVESRLNLNFNESELTVTEAFSMLAELDARLELGLIKIAPDLVGDGEGQVFVTFNRKGLPEEFTWFRGGDVNKIVSTERLANSYPDGFYLVTNHKNNLGEFTSELARVGVEVGRKDASILDSLVFIVQEKGFAAAVLASLSLITALALFWLTLKAKGRALRVLGGCPTIRIQLQDLTGFGAALFISASIVALVGLGYVGLFYGWLYVVTFLKVLLILEVTVIVISLLVALIMSATAWPSAKMLATRQPAVKSLRKAAIVIQVLTFLLVVSAAGPAWTAYKHSANMAIEMAQWKQLSDQVAIVFATDGNEMSDLEPQIGELVGEAEALSSVAFSYTYHREVWPAVDFAEYSGVSFVNERWIDLVTEEGAQESIDSVPIEHIPEGLVQEIWDEVDFLSKEGISKEIFENFQFLQPAEGLKLPLAPGGAGERLQFTNDVLIVVVPSLYELYNDSTLTSMVSSSNIIFTGVNATQQLLEKHNLHTQGLRDLGLNGELNVVFVAEEGILLAQYAAYVVWLLTLALIALAIAFTIAASISALITGLLRSKHDFPMRLAGRSWVSILQNRVLKELFVGAIIIVVFILFQKPEAMGAILVVAIYGLLIVPLSHLFAARWCFNGVIKRRI